MMSGSISAEDTEGESVLASPLALGGLLAGFGILSSTPFSDRRRGTTEATAEAQALETPPS